VIGVLQFFFRVLAAEPDACGRCGGDIVAGDVVVRASDVGPCTLWHRSCVFVSDEDASAFRAAQRRKSQRRATTADPRQGLLGFVPPCSPKVVTAEHHEQAAHSAEAVPSQRRRKELPKDGNAEPNGDALSGRPGLWPHRHDRAHRVSVARGRRG
jgi:hypothetical protein